MEIARKLLVIYFRHRNVTRRLNRYGNLIYVSRRMKYAYLYVDADQAESTMQSIKRIKGVANVEESLVDLESFNFSL